MISECILTSRTGFMFLLLHSCYRLDTVTAKNGLRGFRGHKGNAISSHSTEPQHLSRIKAAYFQSPPSLLENYYAKMKYTNDDNCISFVAVVYELDVSFFLHLIIKKTK